MSYIGRGIDSIDNISTLDNLSFNGSDATFNLTQNSVAFVPVSADALQIQIDGVIQSGNYTVSGSTVTFDFTPSGSSVCNGIRHFGVGLLTTVSDSSITTAKLGADSVNGSKIADNSISNEHLDITAITGQTAITSLADTDKFLVSDASDSGNLKYVESQYIGGGSLVYLGGINASNHNANTLRLEQVFADDYRRYKVMGKFQGTANNADIRFRWLKSDNVEEQSNYHTITGGNKSNSVSISSESWLDWGQQYSRMFTETATGSHIFSFSMDLFPNQNENVNYPTAIFQTQAWGYNGGANRQRFINGVIYNEITTSVAGGGMQLQSTSGLFGTVNMSIWGYKDS